MDQVERKKSMLLMLMVILVALVALVGISFALYGVVVDDDKIGKIVTGGFTINYETYDGYCSNSKYYALDSCQKSGNMWIKSSNSLSMSGLRPVSDAVGASVNNENSIIVFGVSADSNAAYYTVSLIDLVFGETLSKEYIKINLMKNGKYVLGSSDTGVLLDSLEEKENSIVLNSTTIDKNTKDVYVLRAWIDNTYSPEIMEKEEDNKHVIEVKKEEVSFRIRVYAEIR